MFWNLCFILWRDFFNCTVFQNACSSCRSQISSVFWRIWVWCNTWKHTLITIISNFMGTCFLYVYSFYLFPCFFFAWTLVYQFYNSLTWNIRLPFKGEMWVKSVSPITKYIFRIALSFFFIFCAFSLPEIYCYSVDSIFRKTRKKM